MNKQERKQKLKEKRCKIHVIHTCEKYNLGYRKYSGFGDIEVYDFINKTFVFSESTSDNTIFELRDKLDVYIKHNKTSHL